MKFILLSVAFLATLGLISGNDINGKDVSEFTSLFSGVSHAKANLQTFTNQQLEKSFDFLLLSFTFDKYELDRPGLEKLYRKISDKAWEDTVGLVKYQSKRGLTVELNGVHNDSRVVGRLNEGKVGKASLLDSDELSSLKLALGYEKILATESHRIHQSISHAHGDGSAYDPDVAHYLDEEIIEYQSGIVRKLTGYIHNLHSIIEEANTKDMGIHLFDQYLEKAE
ncbi:ferritin heavy chain B-like [Toxorhynchites rutilus septentrionalis]|uniref:ferritin heavy chain B-like n=1 Tax=Toxorhynchites rutilus septentrionalis TaxID=329112 RepID=UPI0024795513|nr:ferritin heavy chain B-like [Toxorhynchites rutilus septentrionalis]XP_055616469.1 ferritin heavy chain B-like [Toxorhynchites rutilus septentrionalis]XP_055616470.1 ferritin heavy chain B-like [Toxorhynchites rutilus septentrionalis]